MPGTTTNTGARTNLLVRQRLLDAPRQFLRQQGHVFVGLKTTDDAELFAHQIGHEDVSARRADVDADNAALPRVDVKKSRTTSAADCFANGALQNQRLGQQFADQQTRDSAPDVHQSREVGAGDWLVLANQVESDLAVDLAGGTATCDFEIVWVNLTHSEIVRS
jgi:hypothetical protein